MKRLLLALGGVLILSAPVLATPGPKTINDFHKKAGQLKPVTGKVTNDKGDNLAGVSVSSKSSTRNTVTAADGSFSLAVADDETTLIFSYVGMETQSVNIVGKTNVQVQLKSSTNNMEDLVVVGYGTKKRANLLGAVASIKAEEVEDLPVANLGTALVNRLPGVGVSVASGKPGATTTISIRNPTLFAASGRLGLTADPLFIIDGITVTKQDFDNLDASLVDNLSFLKDASAAVYGAAGAKGVVLVTTKRGKPGKAKISYSGYYGNSTAASKPNILSAYDHAKMLNDGYNINNSTDISKFSQADLNFLATDPYESWYDQLWHSANLTRHTLNVSGGTDRITFFAGGNYYNEGGNLGEISIKKYGIRSGMDAKVSQSISASISLNTDYAFTDRNTLKGSSTETEDYMIRALYLTPRWVPLTVNGLPNNWNGGPNPPGAWNPVALFNSGEYERNKSQGITLNASLTYKPLFLNGLTVKVQYGKINRAGTSKQYFPSYNTYNFVRSGQNGLLYTTTPTASPVTSISNTNRLQEGTSYNNSYQLISSINYARKFRKHDFDLLVLTEQTEAEGNSYLNYRDGQQIPGIDQMFAFNAANTTVQLNGASESGKRSYLARLNYSFNNKYLLEFVSRYDASANFPPSSRWGLFPALGLGWRVSEENFFKDNIHFINTFKLRANVGIVGDDRVNNYQYIARFTQTTGMLFGTTVTNGLDPSIYPNPDITWEKARTENYGFDATFLNNRLNISADFWYRHTYDGLDDLGNATLPYTVGIQTGLKNYGIQNNWGRELTIGYRVVVNKNLQFNIDANFGTSGNQLVRAYYSPGKIGGVTEYQDILIGKSSNVYNSNNYGYISKGILRTQADVDAILNKNPNYKINGFKPQVGFLDYVDVNNDGVITESDITLMYDNTATRLSSGLTFGVSYKTFKFSTNIGIAFGGKKFYDSEARKVPTTGQSAPDFWKDHWTPENPNAKYPRADAPFAKENSTFWAVSGTAGRINNAVISYSMPKRISDRYKIPDMRILIAGTNLWNIVNPYKYKDISTSNFASYPTIRTISVGLNVTL